MTTQPQKEFLTEFAKRNYTDIFITRIKFGGSHVGTRKPLNSNLMMFANENNYGTKRNVLYISIPFCLSKCKYCFFFKSPFNERTMEEYIDSLEMEARIIKDTPYLRTTKFESIYFGGGTPSTLTAAQISRLLKIIYNSFHVTDDVEITFESNPYSLTEDKMKVLHDHGVNRVSLGVQTFNDEVLRKMNCRHNKQEAINAIHNVLKYGLKLNVDMIFGFQGQDKQMLEDDFAHILYLDPLQLTYFPLRISPDTLLFDEKVFYNKELRHKNYQKLLDYDRYIGESLSRKGFNREEIPIFYYSKKSTPHRYGSLEGRIIGLGAGGGTLFDQSESVNVFDVKEYIHSLKNGAYPVLADSVLTMQQSFERFIFYRILFMDRNMKNFREKVEAEFEDYFQQKNEAIYDKVVADMTKRDLIRHNGPVIKFTPKFDSILENFKIGMPSIN